MQREDTPLRSIHDPDTTVADTTVATVDEHFDAEFMGENFFDGVDIGELDDVEAGE